MSVKIKINWDNENVVSESVRIYRADFVFTSNALPQLLTEIIGDVYEYEDFAVTEGSTYFYMLSTKLGEQEVFTECFEVKVSKEPATLNFVKALTSPSRYSVPSSAWPLTVPSHNAGDIVIVFKNGADTELASYGFTKLDVSGLTDNFMHPWYKIATINQSASVDISLSNTSDKTCIILRPSRPVTEVLFELSSNSSQFVGPGNSSSMVGFVTPTFSIPSAKKGYFLQAYSPGSAYAGLGKAQTLTVGSPASLLASPKNPIVYDYASAYAEPANSTIKAYAKAVFGQTANGSVNSFGGYNAAINYFSESGATNRFLNLFVAAR
ncbi:hypothetical protein [Acinetobacter sp. FDAARGOS_515]|uniref:hypothetical protein n=1 Tax=Acinetobacter sp. FDAARGOS_515 TaxID=2420307 RepID=UPI000F67DC1A|nr:hypothetical protein [Acinetobacter sp. FDAARGOS_515]RSC23565.1 hypothetical protein EGS47_12820 [Acinetobacter sp. FDAARGOS_515]